MNEAPFAVSVLRDRSRAIDSVTAQTEATEVCRVAHRRARIVGKYLRPTCVVADNPDRRRHLGNQCPRSPG